jgi:hypothetical protein
LNRPSQLESDMASPYGAIRGRRVPGGGGVQAQGRGRARPGGRGELEEDDDGRRPAQAREAEEQLDARPRSGLFWWRAR